MPTSSRLLARAAPVCLGLFVLLACKENEQKPISAPRERSQVVAASPVLAQQASPRAPGEGNAPARVKPRPQLCNGQLHEGKALPKKRLSQAAASDAPRLEDNIKGPSGSWNWVNFWAAWCAPCKEEIPRLLEWQKKLETSGRRLRMTFVSLDDDERQLLQFLQGSSTLRSTYWLKEGREREDWLGAAGLQLDPELPVHLLVDPQGKIRCRVQGAVEDSDYESLVRLLADAR